jgi:hypothetical protein
MVLDAEQWVNALDPDSGRKMTRGVHFRCHSTANDWDSRKILDPFKPAPQENCEAGVWSIFRPTRVDPRTRPSSENMDLTPSPWAAEGEIERGKTRIGQMSADAKQGLVESVKKCLILTHIFSGVH